MQRNSTLFLGFCVLAAVAAYFLQPSSADRMEANTAELAPEAALTQLEKQAAEGTLDRNLRMILADLALRAGHLDTASNALENQRVETHHELAAAELLSAVAQMSGDMAGAARHLEIAYDIAPTAERRMTLGGWYRILRDSEAELGILRSVPATRLSAWEVERLLDLAQQVRQYDALESVLQTLAYQDGEQADVYKARLISYLIQAGRAKSALGAAWRWYKDEDDTRALLISLETFIGRGAISEATALAMRALEENPEEAHVLIASFARSGHGATARALQDHWLALSPDLGDAGWRTLIDLAAFTGDLRALRRELMGVSKTRGDHYVVADALGQILRYQGARALTPFRNLLTESLLKRAPLIGAALEAEQGRDAAVFSYLVAAANLPMRGWERSMWLALADRLRGKPAYRALLETATADEALRIAIGGKFIALTSRSEQATSRQTR